MCQYKIIFSEIKYLSYIYVLINLHIYIQCIRGQMRLIVKTHLSHKKFNSSPYRLVQGTLVFIW